MTTHSRLTREQRYAIEVMTRNGSEQKAIAEAIEVHPSTVSRELRHGGMNRQSYCFVAAQRHAEPGERKVRRVDPAVIAQVEKKLREGQWIPQQISKRIAMEKLGSISRETIYQRIYRDKLAG